MSEHEIQNNIRLALSNEGFTVFRINVGKVKMQDGRWFDSGVPRGFSDLMAIKDGRVYFLEVKSAIGKATADQLSFIKQMENKGCVAGIVRSVADAFSLVQII
jgi:hypothetical protein